jgi:hypothetical protein
MGVCRYEIFALESLHCSGDGAASQVMFRAADGVTASPICSYIPLNVPSNDTKTP